MSRPNIWSISRRSWLVGSVAIGTLGIRNATLAASTKSSPAFRVRAVVKASGEVRLKSQITDARTKDGKVMPAKTIPMQASTTIDFEEQFSLDSKLSLCKSYLHFLEAASEVQVDRHVTKTKLRENCTEIVRIGTDNNLITACLDNPLFAAERDLIEIPVASMFLDKILTQKQVRITDKWDLDPDTICRLLGLEAILDGKLTVCLVDANEDAAQLDIDGRVSGSVHQVATTISVEGKAQLDRKAGIVSWFAANIEETREISESEPGFKLLAQVQIRRAKIDSFSNGESLESVAARIPTRESAELLQFQSDLGYFRFLADRKWTTYRDNGEEATYRFVLDNQRVAQCNVTNMIDLEAGRQLTLEGFVSDVKTSIGAGLVEILESSEKVTSTGLRSIRVASRGVVQDVGLYWVHYHLSNDNGRRVVLVFMLNEEQLEAFGSEDSQIVSTFELIDWPTKLDKKTVEQATKQNESSLPKTSTSANQTPNARPKLAR